MPPRVPLPYTKDLARTPWKQAPRILTKQKIFELSKNYMGRNRNCNRIARNRVEKGLQHAYRNRKVKTRNARKHWIQRVNAGARSNGLKYSQLVHGMRLSNIQLNRKILADLAVNEPLSFAGICRHARLRPEVTPKIYPSYGYVQSAVVTQVVQKPIKHLGTNHQNAFLVDEHKNAGEILEHTTFRMPMYQDYAQIELPTRHDYSDFLHQKAKKKKLEQKEEEQKTKDIDPEGLIRARDIPRGKSTKHYIHVKPTERYVNPEI